MKFSPAKFFLLLIFPICIFLTFNKHSKDEEHSFYGVIWADAAGYYVHNPIWFIYGNDANQFPMHISEQTGDGFYLDSVSNKVITKYPCGAAILQTPFFLASHFLAKPLGYASDGFSKIYAYGLYFSGIIYVCLGMLLLSLFLQKHFSTTLSIVSPLLLFLSTNLYYYSIDAPGMSHVYSFFLFALFIYSVQKLLEVEEWKYYFFLVCSFVLLILTRPTNGVILLFPLFYENGLFLSRIKVLLRSQTKIAFSLLFGILLLIPQLFYWKTSFGKWISYSYGNESFTNLLHPKIFETWFSTNNGMFSYAPILLLTIIGMFLMIKNRERYGVFLICFFLLITYIFSSWWCWWFGCSFGARSFVEYYVLLIFPFCYCLRYFMQSRWMRLIVIGFIGLCIVVYFNIEYYYDGCFYGGTWDWDSYFGLFNAFK